MKKFIFLSNLIVINFCVNAQQYLNKDFNDNSANSGGWTINEPIPATTASLTWTTSTAGGAPNAYGMMKNYNGTGNEAVESWLISPSMDLSTATTPLLSFKSAVGYNGAPLEVLISTNYDGTSNPLVQGLWTPLNPIMPLSTGIFFDWTSSGNVDLSMYITTGVYIAFKYTGSSANGSTWEVDDILVNENGAVVPPSLTIYEIQYTVAGNGDSPKNGNTVSTGGVVSALKPNGTYFIQSGTGPWSGIYVYDQNNTVVIGDSLKFEAVVDEFNNASQLTNVSNFNKLSSSNTVDKTAVTTGAALAEMYEGVLVNVPFSNCTDATNSFGEWTINDGSGDCIVDDFLLGSIYNAAVGGPYNVTGIIDYAFGSFLMQPRTLADIISSVSIDENSITNFDFYPNPLNSDNLNVEVDKNSSIILYDYSGKIIRSFSLNPGINNLNLTNISKGLYLIKYDSETYMFSKI